MRIEPDGISPLGQTVSEHRAIKKATDPKYAAAVEKYRIAGEVAQRLVGYRIERELTQLQLAELLKMTDSVVSRLERGDQPTTLETLARIGEVLGFEVKLVDREVQPA